MKKYLFLFFILMRISCSFSQTYTFERRVNSDYFQLKIFKNPYNNANYLYKQTGVGMVPGYLDLVKVDTAGSITKNLAFDFPDSYIERVLPVSDGFLLGATSLLSVPDYTPLLIKFDSTGTVNWTKEYNISGPNLFSKPIIIDEQNNEIYLIGSTYSQSFGLHSFFISQIDSLGNVLSTKVYSHTGNANTDMIIPTDIFKLSNGNYFLVTYLHEPCVPCQSPMVLFLDSSLNVLSAHILYTFQSFPAGFKFIKKPDDGFYLVGTFNPSQNILPYGFIINLNPDLSVIWSKYTDNDVNDYGIDLIDAHFTQNYIVVAGHLYNASTNRNILLMKVDTTGNVMWSKSAGPIARDDELTSWVKDSDAIYVAGSSTDVFNPVTMDGMFMKIDLNGNTTCGNTWYVENLLDFNVMFGTAVVTQSTKNVTISNFTTSPISGMSFSYICSGTVTVSVNDLNISDKLEIYPNPAVDELNISNLKSFSGGELKIYDIFGTVLHREKINSADSALRSDISKLKNGIYFLEIKKPGDGVVVRKFIVNK